MTGRVRFARAPGWARRNGNGAPMACRSSFRALFRKSEKDNQHRNDYRSSSCDSAAFRRRFPLENLIGKPRAAFERDARGPFPPRPQRAPLHARGGEMTQMSLIRGSGEGREGRRRLPGLVNGRISRICPHAPRPRCVRAPACREIGAFTSKVARFRAEEPARRRGPPSPRAAAGAPRPQDGPSRTSTASGQRGWRAVRRLSSQLRKGVALCGQYA